MQKVLFQLEPLSCPSCGKRIEDNLIQQTGISYVHVFSIFSKVRAEFDESETNVDRVEKAISQLGFVVKSKRVEERENET